MSQYKRTEELVVGDEIIAGLQVHVEVIDVTQRKTGYVVRDGEPIFEILVHIPSQTRWFAAPRLNVYEVTPETVIAADPNQLSLFDIDSLESPKD